MAQHTPGPWNYVASTEHHGPYVTSDYGSTISDCYTMSNLADLSVRNGGSSKPVPFMGEMADENARLIAGAPDLLAALKNLVAHIDEKFYEQEIHRMFKADWQAAREAIAMAEGRPASSEQAA